MIKLSSQDIAFEYIEGRHLSTTLTISNPKSQKYLYFKMKVSRQKYFMVKPDKGCIPPQSSETLEITIHKDITSNCEEDQFQLIFAYYETQLDKFPLNLFAEGKSYQHRKLQIYVRGAPATHTHTGKKKANQNDFLSIVNSANQPAFSSGNIQTLIYQAEMRVKKLQEDVEMYRGMSKHNSVLSSVKKKSKLPTLVLTLASLGLGYVIGFFI